MEIKRSKQWKQNYPTMEAMQEHYLNNIVEMPFLYFDLIIDCILFPFDYNSTHMF
jgi:hypothetical protein